MQTSFSGAPLSPSAKLFVQSSSRDLESLPAAVVDLYAAPHRGLRWAMNRLLDSCASADFHQVAERDRVARQVVEVCDLFEHHLQHEEAHVHPALLPVAPAMCHLLEDEHSEHRRHMEALIALAERCSSRAELGRSLYLSVARFCRENLDHMELEETAVQRALEENYDLPSLSKVHAELIASITPESMVAFLRVMLPAMSDRERRETLEGPRSVLPPAGFRDLVTDSSIHLSRADRDLLLSWSNAG